MNVFISWSGSRSLTLARALREWLPLVLHYVKPWLSDVDISAGSRWEIEVAGELEKTEFGIICLTKDNSQSPWITFEAGAISKIVAKTAVCPYLLDLQFQDLYGPLAQFHAKKAEKVSTLELLESINTRADHPIAAETLAELFGALWPKLAKAIRDIKSAPHEPSSPRKAGEILEDVVFSVRRLDYKIDLLATLIAKQFPQSRTDKGEDISAVDTTLPSSTIYRLPNLADEYGFSTILLPRLPPREGHASRPGLAEEFSASTIHPTDNSISRRKSEEFGASNIQISMEGPGLAFQGQLTDIHELAHRLARLLVSEIKLYNEEEVAEGCIAGDIYERLREQIERSREAYEERVDPKILTTTNYFYEELVNILAGGDERKLGDMPAPTSGDQC